MVDKEAGRIHDILRDDVRSIISAKEDRPADQPEADVLQAISPRAVPSIVLSVAAKTPQEVAQLLGRIPAQLDDRVARYPVKIELRFDAIKGFSERMTAAALVFRLGVPLIITLRARREGGHSTATEPERQRFFLSIVGGLRQAPPKGSLIDIEAQAVAADPEGWGQVIAQARERGFHVVLSSHDLDATPTDPKALLPSKDLLDRAPGGAAALWKSATQVNGWNEDLAVLRALAAGNAAARRAAVMGMGPPTSRLLAPFFAAPLVYAAIDRESAVAAGQVPFADLVRVWSRWGIEVEDAALAQSDGTPRPRWTLLGHPAYGSLSPAMHNAAARALDRPERFFPLEVKAEHIASTLEALPELGVVAGSVTMPHKATLAAAADRCTGDAATLGVANCFRYEDGALIADNTDPQGVRGALEEAGVDVARSRVLVIGAGGAAAAAVQAVRDATKVQVTARGTEKVEALRMIHGAIEVVPWDARSDAAREADVLVHATPLGMTGGPDAMASPVDAAALRAGQTVFDTVYLPRRTPLLQQAEEAGATAIDGTAMLLHQGAAAFRLWTGLAPPLGVMRQAIDAASRIELPDVLRPAMEARR